jgi:N4-gp56 family major capsid protein
LRTGGATDDATLSGASYIFDLTMIDKAKELARTASPTIRPVRVGGKDKYVMFLHEYQVTDMRINTSVGQWLDIQKAALAGGDSKGIYDGALGEYNDVVLHSSTRIPLGVANAGTAVSTARRAVLCGAQAACFAYGGENGQEMDWVEETFDYKNKLGVAAGMIAGLKKTIFNSVDFGTVVVATSAAAHT